MLNTGPNKRLGIHHRAYGKIKFTIPFLYSQILTSHAVFELGMDKQLFMLSAIRLKSFTSLESYGQ